MVSCSLVPLPLRCSCSFGCSYPFGVLFLRCSYPSGAPTPPVLLPLRCSYPFGALFLGAPTPSVLAPLRRSDPCDAPTPPTPLPLRCSYPFAPRTPLLLVPWRNLAMPKARSERRNRVHVWGGDGGVTHLVVERDRVAPRFGHAYLARDRCRTVAAVAASTWARELGTNARDVKKVRVLGLGWVLRMRHAYIVTLPAPRARSRTPNRPRCKRATTLHPFARAPKPSHGIRGRRAPHKARTLASGSSEAGARPAARAPSAMGPAKPAPGRWAHPFDGARPRA